MGALTKADIAKRLHHDVGFSQQEAKEFVEAIFQEISESLINGNSVKLSGFGNFVLRDKPERPGRNPKTGVAVPIAARRVVTFKAGQKLKTRVEKYAGTGQSSHSGAEQEGND